MPSFEIETKGRFRRTVRSLPEAQRGEVAHVLDAMRGAIGHPHRHTGLGIRRLRRSFFECRAGRDLRLIFEVLPRTLLFHDAGNHDSVQRFIKKL
jgi:mRNA-degrading endonuclease YafQ of YafQ-DinJ toxin-antitoxin module